MMSWSERRHRRGGATEPEFLAGMARAGFVEVGGPRMDARHEFIHPDTGERRYVMSAHEGYGSAMVRMTGELRASQPLPAPQHHNGRRYLPPYR